MIRLKAALLWALILIPAGSAFALPNYLEDFRKDPFRRPSMDSCAVCHVNPQGGGDRNPFGMAFEKAGSRFTPLLRSEFPDRFVYPTSPGPGNVTLHFSDPDNRQVVMESGGTRTLVDLAAHTVNGRAAATATAGAAPIADAPQTAPQTKEKTSADTYAREGAFYGMNVVNLPNGKPLPARSIDFQIAHRFVPSVCVETDCPPGSAGLDGLFGFDGPAWISFNVRKGITDRISVGFARSNLNKTLEFSSTYQVSRQSDSMPLTIALRGGVEGKNNFRAREQFGDTRWVSSFIQPVVVHTVADRVSLTLAPTFAFNTRDEQALFDELDGGEHNHTIGLGIGAGIRLRPKTSLVGEYIPRVYGFKGGRFTGNPAPRPGVSMGLLTSTLRHTFEIVLSRQEPMTAAQYAVEGLDTFRLGFNIYRRIR